MSPPRPGPRLRLACALVLALGAVGPAAAAGEDAAAEEVPAELPAEAPDAPEPTISPADPAQLALTWVRELVRRGDFHEAEGVLRDALVSMPHHHDLVFQLAQVLRWQGQFEAAFEQLAFALELDPRSVDALVARGSLHAQVGEYLRAQAVVSRLQDIDAPADQIDELKLRILQHQGRWWEVRRRAKAFEREHGRSEQSRAVLTRPRGVQVGANWSIELRQPSPRVDWGLHTRLSPHDRIRLWVGYDGSTWLGDQEHGVSGGVHLLAPKGFSFVLAGGAAWPGLRVARAHGELGFGIRTPVKLELEVGLGVRMYGAADSLLVLGRLGARLPFTDWFAIRAALFMGMIRIQETLAQEPAPGALFSLEVKPHDRVTIDVGYSFTTELFITPWAEELQELLIHRVPTSVTVKVNPRFTLRVGWSLEFWGEQPPFNRFEVLPTLHL